MTPTKRNGIYQLYVPTQAGGVKRRTCDTRDALVYRGMKRMVAELREKRRWKLLAAITDTPHRLSLGQVYDAHTANTLDALEASLSASRLSAHRAGYLDGLRALGRAARYVDGVGAKLDSFIEAAPTGTTADLTPAVVAHHLAGLRTTPGTRRQHLYAVTGFARFLRSAGVLASYPLSGIEAPKKNAARMRYESEATDERIVAAASPKYRALFAFIKATGCDVSTAFRTLRRDLNLEAGKAELRGTKTRHRHVHEGLIEPWALPYLRERCAGMLPNAHAWPELIGKPGKHGTRETAGYSVSGAGHHHTATCEALKVSDYTLKDARHSVAVRMAKAGYTPFEIAEQLGTSPDLVSSTYARFIVKLERRVTSHVTANTTGGA
jgi:integrase